MADELLRALGMRQAVDPDGSDEVRALLRPFEAEERAALLDAVFEQVDREAAVADAEPRPATPQPSATVVELAPARGSRWVWIAAVTAIAAALLLWLGLRGPGPVTPGEAVPSYAATRLDGGSATMRSSETAAPSSISLTTDASIDWIFTPRAPVRTPVAAAVLATSAGQPAVLARPAALEVTEEGVVRISGRLAESLPLAPGTWSVTVLIGDPATLPRTAAEAEHEAEQAGAWSRVSFEVKISAAP
jgi:hypothetical protein